MECCVKFYYDLCDGGHAVQYYNFMLQVKMELSTQGEGDKATWKFVRLFVCLLIFLFTKFKSCTIKLNIETNKKMKNNKIKFEI